MPTSSSKLTAEHADICLLLEGTYPYVRGGVSSWVHQLIQGNPQYQFALVFVGANQAHYEKMHFVFPDNVCHFEEHFLNESFKLKSPKPYHLSAAVIEEIERIYSYLAEPGKVRPINELGKIEKIVTDADKFQIEQFFYSPEIWDLITESYRQNCPEQPFNEYFWTIRAMHSPVLALLGIAKQIPQADCYHSISTGYAGVLGMFLHILKKKPLLLSEHGIYTKERQIDLYQVDWIHEISRHFKAGLDDHINYIRKLWMNFFEGLGKLTYSASLVTVALYEQNRLKQIELGARPERAIAIPNGVKMDRFIPLRKKRSAKVPQVLCLLGRVVPIKDIKTFIRSIGILASMVPEAEGWIVGPEDEDKTYALECHQLVEQLGIEDKVKFLGFQNIDDILPKTGLITLSSISEGQPLVILEGFAAGVPTLSTDVGFSRGMVEGVSVEDRALGTAGAIVPIADPTALAHAAVELLSDEDKWYAAQKAGIARVEKYYTEEIFLDNYQKLYRKVLSYGRNRI